MSKKNVSKHLYSNKKSLNRKYFIISLAISMIFFILSMLTVLFVFHQIIQNSYTVSYKQIESIIPEIERSIENEIIIDNQPGIKAVKSYVKSKYGINKIYISDKFIPCKPVSNYINKSVCFTSKIEKFENPIYLKIIKNININVLAKLLVKTAFFYVLFFILSSFAIYFLLRYFQKLLIKPLIHLSKNPVNLYEKNYEIDEIEVIRLKMLDYHQRETRSILEKKEMEFKLMLSDVASQIVHDLRSPVDTLKYLSNQITFTNTNSHSLFKRCISQIESISSELINSKNITSIDSYHEKNIISLDLCYLLKKEIESKSTLFNIDLIKLGLNITTINAYVKINPYRIKNILNNIINNSIESINQNGEILVSLEIKNEFVIIKISDTGKGFPEQVIHSLGKKPITVGKDGGNGIGLYSAYNYLTAIGGELEIKNNEQGAEVNILILLDKQVSSSQKTPEDIVPYILLDDSQLVLDTWKLRAIEKSINFHGFSHIEPFMVFIRDIDIRSKIYIDSDLGNGLKGEEVAREIYNQGYKNLYIATGFESNKFKELKFLKGVIGKVPPF